MICVSVGPTELRDLLIILNREKRVEVRLDQNDFSDEELKIICSAPATLVAVCRPGKFPEKERIRKLKLCAASGARYIDLEMETGRGPVSDMAAYTRVRDVQLIVSHHNFDFTPAAIELENIYRYCSELGADVVKIACHSASGEDNARLLALYTLAESGALPPLIVVGLGKAGRITRAAAPFLGAPFTYASAENGKETAPGQLDRTLLEKIIEQITHGSD